MELSLSANSCASYDDIGQKSSVGEEVSSAIFRTIELIGKVM